VERFALLATELDSKGRRSSGIGTEEIARDETPLRERDIRIMREDPTPLDAGGQRVKVVNNARIKHGVSESSVQLIHQVFVRTAVPKPMHAGVRLKAASEARGRVLETSKMKLHPGPYATSYHGWAKRQLGQIIKLVIIGSAKLQTAEVLLPTLSLRGPQGSAQKHSERMLVLGSQQVNGVGAKGEAKERAPGDVEGSEAVRGNSHGPEGGVDPRPPQQSKLLGAGIAVSIPAGLAGPGDDAGGHRMSSVGSIEHQVLSNPGAVKAPALGHQASERRGGVTGDLLELARCEPGETIEPQRGNDIGHTGTALRNREAPDVVTAQRHLL
jgi:hypothetical protein